MAPEVGAVILLLTNALIKQENTQVAEGTVHSLLVMEVEQTCWKAFW